jgi:phage-related protein
MGFLQKLWNGAKNFVSPIWNTGKKIYNKLKAGYNWIKQRVSDAANGGLPIISDLAKWAENSGIFGTIDKYADTADSIINYVDQGSTYLDHMVNGDVPHVNALKDMGSNVFKLINAQNQRITDMVKSAPSGQYEFRPAVPTMPNTPQAPNQQSSGSGVIESGMRQGSMPMNTALSMRV